MSVASNGTNGILPAASAPSGETIPRTIQTTTLLTTALLLFAAPTAAATASEPAAPTTVCNVYTEGTRECRITCYEGGNLTIAAHASWGKVEISATCGATQLHCKADDVCNAHTTTEGHAQGYCRITEASIYYDEGDGGCTTEAREGGNPPKDEPVIPCFVSVGPVCIEEPRAPQLPPIVAPTLPRAPAVPGAPGVPEVPVDDPILAPRPAELPRPPDAYSLLDLPSPEGLCDMDAREATSTCAPASGCRAEDLETLVEGARAVAQASLCEVFP